MAFIKNTRKVGTAKLKLITDIVIGDLWNEFDFYLYFDKIYLHWRVHNGIIQTYFPLNDFLKNGALKNGIMMSNDNDDLILLPNSKEVILSYVFK